VTIMIIYAYKIYTNIIRPDDKPLNWVSRVLGLILGQPAAISGTTSKIHQLSIRS